MSFWKESGENRDSVKLQHPGRYSSLEWRDTESLMKSFEDLLKELMESGELVRRGYLIDEEECMDREVASKYNEMVKLLFHARGGEPEIFERYTGRALEIWRSIESRFPFFYDEEVKRAVQNNVGFVKHERCAEIAVKLGTERPMKFTSIADMARSCRSFGKVDTSSFNKVLARTLRYLAQAGFLINTWASRRGGKGKSMYFRIYRSYDFRPCTVCGLIEGVEELIRKYKQSKPS